MNVTSTKKRKIRRLTKKAAAKAPTRKTPQKTPSHMAGFVKLDEFLSLTPLRDTPLSQLKKWERTGKFPRPFRFISRRSTPLYAISDLIYFTREAFAAVPDEAARIETALVAKTNDAVGA